MSMDKTTKIYGGYKVTSTFAKNHNHIGNTCGMFTPHDRHVPWCQRPKLIYRVEHADHSVSLFNCFFTLDHVDLRTWVTLLAVANAKHHDSLAAVHNVTDVVERLALEGVQQFDKSIEFTTTIHQLLVDAGVDPTSMTSRKALKDSLTRLANVTWTHTTTTAETVGSLISLSFANSVEKSGDVSITLNPQLSKLLIVANTAHTVLQMSEVRQLKTACDYILHHYLCSITRQREVRRLRLDTMVSTVWDVDIENLTPHILCRHRKSVKATLKSLESLDWRVLEVRAGVYDITRPSYAKGIF